MTENNIFLIYRLLCTVAIPGSKRYDKGKSSQNIQNTDSLVESSAQKSSASKGTAKN